MEEEEVGFNWEGVEKKKKKKCSVGIGVIVNFFFFKIPNNQNDVVLGKQILL